MNFLAHAYLTPPNDPDLLVGNLTADWIKGRARHALPDSIRRGMDLHRRIDTFTDTHLATACCTEQLEARWSRYAPILVDMFYDHILASHWHHYSPTPLPDFVHHIYTTLHAHRHLLPEHANYAICMMSADDWLNGYATLDGIRLALTRMSSRLHSCGHDIELAPAVDDLLSMRTLLKPSFDILLTDFRKLTEPLRAA